MSTPNNAFLYSGAISGIAGAISSVFAGKTQAIGLEMQASARKAQASQYVSQAKMTNLRLKQGYNEMASNQAIMFAAQGRSFSGGSVQNLMRADQEKLQWDIDYSKLSGEIGKIGVETDAAGFKAAASSAKQAGYQTGLLKLADTATKYASIK